ncbi:hypothetical protein BKA61DRAFT_583272 [Leptodontidium sp. MPI-SDFR-AT-0119]|nr:hypothetical protein BKA61DRAFT_583272 [Leptodontidium sp. MPI-SDFR-AT-0119]
MRTQTLGVVSLSTLSLLTGSVLAKVQSRSGCHGHLKYKGFAYPPRANVQDLKDNQVDLGYEIHEGKLENDKFLAFRNIPYAEPSARICYFTPHFKVTDFNSGSLLPNIGYCLARDISNKLRDIIKHNLPRYSRKAVSPHGHRSGILGGFFDSHQLWEDSFNSSIVPAAEVLRTSHDFDDIKLVVKFTPGLDTTTATTLLSSRRKG